MRIKPAAADQSWCVCSHPAHQSVLELIRASELSKYQDAEGGYIVLATCEDRRAAIRRSEEILLAAYEKDASMVNVRRLVRECAGEKVDPAAILPDEDAAEADRF